MKFNNLTKIPIILDSEGLCKEIFVLMIWEREKDFRIQNLRDIKYCLIL